MLKSGQLRVVRSLYFISLLALLQSWASAQELQFRAPATPSDSRAPAIMRDLAERILPVYQEDDPERYLRNLSALQLVAGNYQAALATRQSLRERRQSADSGRPVSRGVVYDIYARARAIEATDRVPFAQAFAQAFREVVPHLSDQDAYALTGWLATPIAGFRDNLQKSFDQRRTKGNVALADAVNLIWAYLSYDAYRSFRPLVDALTVDDDAGRYITDEDVLIRTPGAATFSAVVVRPKNIPAELPTLLEFTIDVSPQNSARECAAHGYVGVVAYARGKRRSPEKVDPFQHDGEDATAVINWIAKQFWSDGRVGMFGGNYSGFTQWAAAKTLPSALKAIATWSPSAPGIDVPMVGAVFQSSAYRWISYVTNTEGLDEISYYDDPPWRFLDQTWYASGKPYRDLDRTFDAPSPIFHLWLKHPSYDPYWRLTIPTKEQFAHITIPVLTTTGYYGPGEIGALYYFTEHNRYNPHANHTLLIGPYDDSAMRRGPAAILKGYQVDSAAVVDLRELRYQWFDYVLRGADRPTLLKDNVNYELMGTNEWRHVPSLEAMSKGTLRFYLDATAAGDDHQLAVQKPAGATFVEQTTNFADRSDANWGPPPHIIGRPLEVHNGIVFMSEQLAQPVEFSGQFAGRLDFSANKKDLDLNILLYELLPNGDYLQLFDPQYELRASFAKDRSHRQLLTAGAQQQLTFKSDRLTSRKLQAGSRLVMVLGINKRPDQEVNYGTGGDVSAESVADAKIPLKVRWFSSSYIDIPVPK
jgi:putative CocE/NonD family hydrolase